MHVTQWHTATRSRFIYVYSQIPWLGCQTGLAPKERVGRKLEQEAGWPGPSRDNTPCYFLPLLVPSGSTSLGATSTHRCMGFCVDRIFQLPALSLEKEAVAWRPPPLPPPPPKPTHTQKIPMLNVILTQSCKLYYSQVTSNSRNHSRSKNSESPYNNTLPLPSQEAQIPRAQQKKVHCDQANINLPFHYTYGIMVNITPSQL